MGQSSEKPSAQDAAMFAALMDDPDGVDVLVDPRDEMLQHSAGSMGATRARFDYFRLGHELATAVEQLADWAFGPERAGVAVLEFACGYGRNLRHLVRRFPPAAITASDIDADALAFVTERFGVAAKLSVADPDALAWDERFDLIIVPSLFSHLPDATFGRWLGALHGLLTPRGVLAFSVHDASLTPALDLSGGIHFTPFSEALGRLDAEEYGTTHVTEAYVARQVEQATGERRYGRVPRGFWDHQDVYLTSGPEAPDPASFAFRPPIMGHVDELETDGGVLRVSGWAHAVEPGLTVRVSVGGEVVLETAELTPRPAVAHVRGPEFADSGYEGTFALPAGAAERGELVVVEGRTPLQRRCFYALPPALEPEPELAPSPSLLGRLKGLLRSS